MARELPAKRIIAKVLFYNDAGELLIVKPTYLDRWGLVGGVVEEGESVLDGALRETHEEMGLRLSAQRCALTFVHYTSPADFPDHIHFLFRATLSVKEIAAIHLAPQEISEYKFITPSDIVPYFKTPIIRALADMWIQGYKAGYGQNGHFVAPITT